MTSGLSVLDQIARGDMHRRGALRCARLFDLAPEFFRRVVDDVQALAMQHAPSEVGSAAHVTNWTRPFGRAVQFSLLNGSGDFADTSVDHNMSVHGKRFHHADRFPALAEFIGFFPHATNMRLNGMGPKGGLSPHEEHVMWRDRDSYHLRARFHLPILTNPDALVWLDGDYHHLEAGSVYFFNNGCIHSAVNHGTEQRYHLVWDMLMTEEAVESMFGDEDLGPLNRPSTRQVPVVRREPVREYAISGDGEALYRRHGLARYRLKPHHWQNLYNVYRFADYRWSAGPAFTSVK